MQDDQQMNISNLFVAFFAVAALVGGVVWLNYCAHFSPPGSWQRRIFSGENGVLAVAWFALLIFPPSIIRLARVKLTASPADFPMTAAKNIGLTCATFAPVGFLLGISGPLRTMLTVFALCGIAVFFLSDFILRKRAARTQDSAPK